MVFIIKGFNVQIFEYKRETSLQGTFLVAERPDDPFGSIFLRWVGAQSEVGVATEAEG